MFQLRGEIYYYFCIIYGARRNRRPENSCRVCQAPLPVLRTKRGSAPVLTLRERLALDNGTLAHTRLQKVLDLISATVTHPPHPLNDPSHNCLFARVAT